MAVTKTLLWVCLALTTLCVVTRGVTIPYSGAVQGTEESQDEPQPAQDTRGMTRNCPSEKLQGFQFSHFYPTRPHVRSDGRLELAISMKGRSDGYILLSTFAKKSAPFYLVLIGSHNNTLSEIHRSDWLRPVLKLQTPGMMSETGFEDFEVVYMKNRGRLYVYKGTSKTPFLYFIDSDPLPINFFSLSTSSDSTIDVSLNCTSNRGFRFQWDNVPDVSNNNKQGPTTPEELSLKLLKGYNTNVPPSKVSGFPTVVKLALNVYHIMTNQYDEFFIINGWMYLEWQDSRLVWDDSEIKDLRFEYTEVWTPSIDLLNSAYPQNNEHFGTVYVQVSSDGTVKWNPPVRYQALCPLNFADWPYDTHTCKFILSSLGYDQDEVVLDFLPMKRRVSQTDSEYISLDSPSLYFTRYVKNSLWRILGSRSRRTTQVDACCRDPHVNIEFLVMFQRRSPLYAACVVLPVFIVAIVNLVAFLLPVKNLGRIVIPTSNLFVLCMFLIYFEYTVLSQSDSVPRLVLLYDCELILTCVSLVMSAILLNFSSTRRPLSAYCRAFLNSKFGKVLDAETMLQAAKMENEVEMRAPAIITPGASIEEINVETEDQRARLMQDELLSLRTEWMLFAIVINRLSLMVYFIITVVIVTWWLI